MTSRILTLTLTAAISSAFALAAVASLYRSVRRRRKLAELRSVADFELAAKSTFANELALVYYGYYNSRSDERRVRDVLDDIVFVPKAVMTGAMVSDPSAVYFGRRVELPVVVAPTALHNLAHPLGEIETCKGASGAGAIYSYNYFLSSKPVRKVVEALASGGTLWLHLYIFKEREMVRRALHDCFATEDLKGKFSAVIVTLDHPHDRVRDSILPVFRRKWLTGLTHIDPFAPYMPNLTRAAGMAPVPGYKIVLDASTRLPGTNDDSLAWEDLMWLKDELKALDASVPLVGKGVLTVRDALRAMECGCQGICVSAHGFRQVGSTVTPMEVLREICAAVRARYPDALIFVDSGFRSSLDVLKAVAFGADGVLMGRPVLYALACGGGDAIATMFDALRRDVKDDMKSLGVESLEELRQGGKEGMIRTKRWSSSIRE